MMNGVVIVDKPAGQTSHDVVARVKKILGVRKAGHTGTLDPLATGVLPVCLNEATKLAQFLTAHTKDYRATMLLGVETETLDIEGKVVTERDVPAVTASAIEEVLKPFTGVIKQKAPDYSAVKYKGKTLYRWARKGIVVESPIRSVEIYDLTLEEVALPYVTFTVSCSAGTYVRSICADVGNALGCGACLSSLRRLRSGEFHLGTAISLDDEENLRNRIIPMTEAVAHLPSFPVDELWVKRLKDGVQPTKDIFQDGDISFLVAGDMIKFVTDEGRLVAISSIDQSSNGCDTGSNGDPVVKILRIFHDQ